MNARLLRLCLLAILVPSFSSHALPQAAAGAQSPPSFEQADLEALVAEVVAVAPENPAFQYPVTAQLVEQPEINAYASFVQQDDLQLPVMVVFRGIVERAHADKRMLRAVIAHEIAHLSMGHVLRPENSYRDLGCIWTRMQEHEADEQGAQYLEKLGKSREDMVDVLQMLDKVSREGGVPWLLSVTSDHSSPMMRAAYIMRQGDLVEAVSRFEIGLGFMECRRYEQAQVFFDQALAIQPGLKEAYLNNASAALQDYYDRLPVAAQEAWLRPEFGPHLTRVMIMAGRGVAVGDDDLIRYGKAIARIEAVPSTLYGTYRRFLWASARVLHPRGDENEIRDGVTELQKLLDETPKLSLWESRMQRLCLANNLALGLQRLGQAPQALQVLMTEQAKDMHLLPSLAENLARLPLSGLTKDQAALALGVLQCFVGACPADAPGTRQAEKVMEKLAQQHGFTAPTQSQRAPVTFCRVATMVIDGTEVGLFDPFSKVTVALQAIPSSGLIDEKFADLSVMSWGDDEVIALVEGESLAKLTSYRPDSYLEIRPIRETGIQQVYRVRVGMKVEELEALLVPAGGSEALKPEMSYLVDRASLAPADENAGIPQMWTYYPTLNFGVLLVDGQVSAITVTPVS